MPFPTNVDATWANAPDASSNPVYDGAELRRADAALVAGLGSGPFGVRGGIVLHGPTSLQVTVDGSDVCTVQPGPVIIPGDAVSGTGVYRSAIVTAASGSLAARHATLSRIDLVVFRMLDVDVVAGHGAGNRFGQVTVITGTPSGSPVVPAKPSMAVELARITVPATGGGAATVDSSFRTFATSHGGELLVTTASQLPASAPTWQRARALDTGKTYTWNGAAWDDGTWTAFTPGLINWTVGSGTLTGRKRIIDGKTLHFDIDFVVGNGTIASVPNFVLPHVLACGLAKQINAIASVEDVSAGNRFVRFVRTSTITADRLAIEDTTGTTISATVPFTFASGDMIRITGSAEIVA